MKLGRSEGASPHLLTHIIYRSIQKGAAEWLPDAQVLLLRLCCSYAVIILYLEQLEFVIYSRLR